MSEHSELDHSNWNCCQCTQIVKETITPHPSSSKSDRPLRRTSVDKLTGTPVHPVPHTSCVLTCKHQNDMSTCLVHYCQSCENFMIHFCHSNFFFILFTVSHFCGINVINMMYCVYMCLSENVLYLFFFAWMKNKRKFRIGCKLYGERNNLKYIPLLSRTSIPLTIFYTKTVYQHPCKLHQKYRATEITSHYLHNITWHRFVLTDILAIKLKEKHTHTRWEIQRSFYLDYFVFHSLVR